MRLLVVQHEPECPPALLGAWLTEEGVALDVRHPYAGDELPATLADHSGLLVLGGHMGANDDADHAWLSGVKELFRDAAARRAPALGVCLGHQLAAVALGGTVRRNPLGRQMGLWSTRWSGAVQDDPLLGPLASPRRGIQWNDDIVTELPAGAADLARTERGELQAARFAPTVWGVQLHPEADATVVRAWVADDPTTEAERHLETIVAAQTELVTAWRPLAVSFAALLRAGVPVGR